MATAAPERRRARRGWVRRLETDAPLRIEIEPVHPERGVAVPLGLAFTAPAATHRLQLDLGTALHRPLESVESDGAAAVDCTLVVGEAASVSLANVDARTAARPRPRTSQAGAGRRVQRRPVAKRELSLAERLLLVLQPPLEALLETQGLLQWPAEIRPYQLEGVRALVESDALLLADDMGLGKTIQAIAAIRVLVHLRRAERLLVVAPASLLSQWRRELETWAPELRVEVVRAGQDERLRMWARPRHIHIVGYETLRQDADPLRRYGPHTVDWDVVVLDEAQKVKNRGARVSVACKSLLRRRAWALTGTPLENSIDDLQSIVEFLTPRAADDPQPPLLTGEQLLQRHREIQLRRRKADVLTELPAKTVSDVWLQLAPEQRATYERAEREGVIELKGLGERITTHHVLALIQQLKRICNVCPTSGASAKLDDMRERLEQIAAEGQRALVFSQYTDKEFGVHGVIDKLRPFHPLPYDGSMSARRKEEIVDAFKRDDRHKALVLSLRAGGFGLNLQEASYVFHFDRWWNPAIERQAEDRAHRMGQKSAVTVYRYICEDTIEERIDEVLRRKQHLFDELVDHVSLDPGKLFGEKEIFGLFNLMPPERGGGSAAEELAA